MRESGLYRQIEFDTMEAFRQAQRLIVRRGRLGGRYLKLDLVRCTNLQAFHSTLFQIQKLVHGLNRLLLYHVF